MFASTFGVKYEAGGITLVRPISAYEMACCFQIDSELTYAISHPAKSCLLESGVPLRTSSVLLDAILKRLDKICTQNFKIFNPSRYSAPASIAQVTSFTNGAIGLRIPDNKVWQKDLKDYPMTNLLLEIVANPDLGDYQKYIQPLHSVYRQPARQKHFSTKDRILFIKEIFENDVKYVDLRIVSSSLTNIIFVAFHANPNGGNLNVSVCLLVRSPWPHSVFIIGWWYSNPEHRLWGH